MFIERDIRIISRERTANVSMHKKLSVCSPVCILINMNSYKKTAIS